MAAVLSYPPRTNGFETRRVSTTEEEHAPEMMSGEESHQHRQVSKDEHHRDIDEVRIMRKEDRMKQDHERSRESLDNDGVFDEYLTRSKGSLTRHKPGESTLAIIDDDGHNKETLLKLTPDRLHQVTSSPKWLPKTQNPAENSQEKVADDVTIGADPVSELQELEEESTNIARAKDSSPSSNAPSTATGQDPFAPIPQLIKNTGHNERFGSSARTVSTPYLRRSSSVSKGPLSSRSRQVSSSKHSKGPPVPLKFDGPHAGSRPSPIENPEPSPMPQSMPVPPLSLPTYLQLELSSHRPSPLYIHRSITSDFPYESSRVKIDRLKNFLYLPYELEQILWFGALACLDAWLFSFTILPLRFLKALFILSQYFGSRLMTEVRDVALFIYAGTGRIWRRQRRRGHSDGLATISFQESPHTTTVDRDDAADTQEGEKYGNVKDPFMAETRRSARKDSTKSHRRTKSVPSSLLPDHKADILKGLLILFSCMILMYFDASRMYHGIRGQAAIKLYVIYNVLEVCDRLFSALGQDVLECLFSKETLERTPDGRSKLFRPFWLFMLALCYNLVHSTALFYQVITLNVAVNSYSNALLTLLMSNQFVEIKSTVFKKFEKENLFQLTCADVVERFQLWLMLTIIASRNIIETGGLSLAPSGASGINTSTFSFGSSILPKSFTLFPEWTGQIMGPFLLVLGSEMLVDWIKHAYITKFNMTKPGIYGRFLDVLAKDYYSNAFADQNLTKRLGLPVIPLACLFIRASVQTYHMFLATHMPVPLPSTATSISLESASASPATTAAIQHIDQIFRRALGRSTFGAGDPTTSASIWDLDDIVAFVTMAVFFLVLYLVLLAFKLILGMLLLSYARHRYVGMKERESTSVHAEGKRVGGWGVVEVDEDKRRWIYNDDPDGARRLREREREIAEKEKRVDKEGRESFGGVSRYDMVAKRIW